jgi:hypothetical protein
VPFLIFLKSFEVLLYEVMSWLFFYPRTLWRAMRHPPRLMERTDGELKLAPAEQFRDLVSPPIFLLITVVAANAFQVALIGDNPLIDEGIGLAAMITDNTSLILFRLVVFASLPVVAGALALTAVGRPIDRDTLQPFFYAQCFALAPVVLLFSAGETLTRLPQRAANIPAGVFFIVATLFYLGVETRWFAEQTKGGLLIAFLWATAAFLASSLVVAGMAVSFSGL